MGDSLGLTVPLSHAASTPRVMISFTDKTGGGGGPTSVHRLEKDMLSVKCGFPRKKMSVSWEGDG